MMRKDDFNKLNLKEQIDFINKNLDSKTLTEISKEIKISRSTIRKRFLKQGYIFDKNKNKYIYSSEANNKTQEEYICNNNTNVLEEKIKVLELKIEAIESELNNKNKEFNAIEIKKFEGKTVSRCYRIYEDIQKEFSKFCKENSNYKMQDILSTALYEYMKNNKDKLKKNTTNT